MSPKIRALAATILFSITGCWALLFHTIPWEFVIPNGIFYAVLTINTYFSIRFYSAFTPDEPFQTFIDLLLAASYIGLALTIGIPVAFAFFALLIFVVAPAKYAHMLGKTPHDKTLRRKILIDLLGTFTCAFVLGLSLIGLELKAAWILAVLFTLANIYLLAIKPMYRFVH
jgi:hypothetical protein